MNEVTDAQKRRAVNIIWNSAKDYSFQPDFKAYDSEGQAELYWNYPQVTKSAYGLLMAPLKIGTLILLDILILAQLNIL